MANVMIDIAAEFVGNKAFKQADTATQKLTKNVRQLAGAFGVAFGTTAVLAYGKAAVKAAAADQKAQQQLALALKNVGLERDAVGAEGYIQRLQSEFGIVDDLLRPSYQTLAIATRDSAEAQRLMGIALDVSAANSLDLGAVTKALSRAFLGNNTALSRLQVGISKADLKTKSFKEITDQLSATFAGSATAAANSYQGSMDKLAVATENFKESIGVGLIEALNILNGQEGLAKTTSEVDKLGIKLQNATIGAAYFVDELKKIPGGSLLTSLLGKTFGDPLGIKTLINAFEELKQQPRPFSTPMTISGQSSKSSASAQTKLAKETLKVNKENLKLTKAKAIFDLQKIQIEAALKGKISEEDRIRLLLMKAIEDENISQIEKYTKLLDDAQKNTEKLVSTLAGIKPLDDIFKNFNFMSVKEQLASLTTYFNNFAGSAASAFNALNQQQQAALGGYKPFVGASIPSLAPSNPSMPSSVGLGTSGTGNQVPAGVTINVNTGIGDPNAIAEAIDDVLTNARNRGTLIGGVFAV
jgi:hypothetical protein